MDSASFLLPLRIRMIGWECTKRNVVSEVYLYMSESFADLFEESLQTQSMEPGSIVIGTVERTLSTGVVGRPSANERARSTRKVERIMGTYVGL